MKVDDEGCDEGCDEGSGEGSDEGVMEVWWRCGEGNWFDDRLTNRHWWL